MSDPPAINPRMSDEQTIARVRELRIRGLSPREIARNLGIKPAVVSDIVRTSAERGTASGENERVDCLLNAGWSTGLTIDGHPEWHDSAPDESIGGLVTALVVRRRRHRRGATMCVYLLDVYCLGVKNAMGPDTLDEQAIRRLTARVFSGYETPPIAAPIELVRELVLGAANYAHHLGFAPHPDFEHARAHLGPCAPSDAITFGRDGKPCYHSGPYDNTDHIIRTLQRAVGRNGFNYTIGVDVDQLPLTG
jgi:hypothetical protein